MRFASAIATNHALEDAIAQASDEVCARLGDATATLVVVFVSPHYGDRFERIPGWVAERFPGAVLLGCSAGGVIGGLQELEGQQALSITAAALPGVDLAPFGVTEAGEIEPSPPAGARGMVLLVDPFSAPASVLIEGLSSAYPGTPVVGGLASGADEPGQNALFLGEATRRVGGVGIALYGNLTLDTIVAQGCRAIGQPMFVTRAHQNLLFELDGKPAAVALQETFAEASPADQLLMQKALHLGVGVDTEREVYRQGDFLVRNLIGMDPEKGVLAVAALCEPRQVVQFHVRDAEASAQDLERLLDRARAREGYQPPAGGLLFSCLGRGVHIYGKPDHDSSLIRSRLGEVPLGGFFCSGEIGPVEGRLHLHGYTSALGLFRPLAPGGSDPPASG
jgi:small ligand-binding sensory domain FIST